MLGRRRHRRHQEDQGAEALSEGEREILDALKNLRDTTAREVMTPRVDVVALAAPVTVADVMRAVRESGHSRFPVYENDLDRLLGVLFVKDLFRTAWKDLTGPEDKVLVAGTPSEPRNGPGSEVVGRNEVVGRRLRKPFLAPEGRKVLELLTEMRQRRHAFAVVVDEYGGVEGVLTIKDLVSELVGELPDEFDIAEEAPIVRVDADRWLVSGDCPIDDLNQQLSADVPEGEYVTVAGFLFERFGHIPDEGETLDYEGWEFRVADMDKRRIAKVVVRSPSTTIKEQAGKPADGM